MLDIKVKLMVNPDKIVGALKKDMLKKAQRSISKDVGKLRCTKHGSQTEGEIEGEVCCEEFAQMIENFFK